MLALALGALVVGCGGDDDAEDSDSATTQAVTFQADAGTKGEMLLDLGGLTLKGFCQRLADQIHLTVTVTTASDNAVLVSSASQASNSSPFTVVLDDFDRSFGEYDLMGKASDEIAGTLNYMPSAGGQVVVDWAAAQGTAQGDCVFGGVATHAP